MKNIYKDGFITEIDENNIFIEYKDSIKNNLKLKSFSSETLFFKYNRNLDLIIIMITWKLQNKEDNH